MHYEDRVVCFIDILGFKNHIKQTINKDGTDNTIGIQNLIESFDLMRETAHITEEDRLEKEVTQFSDSLVISFHIDKESGVFYALLEILWIQIELALRGLLCRGGIVRGKLIHTPKLLLGPAMVEVYELESQVAVYPRVILGESIIHAGFTAHASHNSPMDELESIMKVIEKDLDGMYYIDYITKAQSELNDVKYPYYLCKLQKLIKSGIGVSMPSVAIKYKWLEEKFSSHLSEVKENAKKYDIGDDLKEKYKKIPSL